MAIITTYKGYTVETVGITRYIYRPGVYESAKANGCALSFRDVSHTEQSMTAAKHWINQDRAAKIGGTK